MGIITNMMKYPIYLDLEGKRVVVIGAGSVAARKIEGLIDTSARIVVVASQFDSTFEATFTKPNIEMIQSPYSKEYIAGALLVIAATDNNSLNSRIYSDCQEQGVLCNVVDEPDLCDFFVPAVIRRGNLQIAVSTDGNCPAYSGHIRRKLEEIFTDTHADFVEELETVRRRIIADVPNSNSRKAILGKLVNDESFEFFKTNGREKWRQYALVTITQST